MFAFAKWVLEHFLRLFTSASSFRSADIGELLLFVRVAASRKTLLELGF
jgi:hypothetical protein